jgi:ribosome-binding factor A
VKKTSQRHLQYGEEIKRNLVNVVNGITELDSISNLITIQRVIVNNDFKICKVYFRCDDNISANVAIILNSSGKILAYKLSKEMNMRAIPELRFYFDDTLAILSQIDEAIGNIEE